MVYCTWCGAKNEDNAKICVSCGGPISYPSRPEEKRVYKQREMCFGETERRRDNIGLISFGIFLALAGIIYAYTPNLGSEFRLFFRDWHLIQVAQNVYLPAPSTTHPVLYLAVAEFCFIFGVFQIVLLLLEFVQNRSTHRKAQTVSGIVFWLGSGYLVYLLSIESILWFQFWVMLLILIGISLIVRGAITAFARTVSTSAGKPSL